MNSEPTPEIDVIALKESTLHVLDGTRSHAVAVAGGLMNAAPPGDPTNIVKYLFATAEQIEKACSSLRTTYQNSKTLRFK